MKKIKTIKQEPAYTVNLRWLQEDDGKYAQYSFTSESLIKIYKNGKLVKKKYK
jgi:hypothetical protein